MEFEELEPKKPLEYAGQQLALGPSGLVIPERDISKLEAPITGYQTVPEGRVLGSQVSEPPKEVGIQTSEEAEKQTIEDQNYLNQVAPPPIPISPTTPTTPTTPTAGFDVDIIKGTDRIRINSNELTKYMSQGYQIAPTIPTEVLEEGDEEKTPEQIALDKAQSELDAKQKELDKASADLDTYKSKVDDSSLSLISSIQNLYQTRRDAMAEINERSRKAMETIGIRYGTAEFASMIARDILTAEERAGQMRLAQLDAEESQLVAEAKKAATNKEYDILHDKIELIKADRDEKNKVLVEMQKLALAKSEELEKKKIQSSRDSAIAEIISKYQITDVGQLLDLLNFDENGNPIGDITAEEVNNVLKPYLENLKTQQSLTQSKGELKQLDDGEWAWIYPPTADNPQGQTIKTGVKGKVADETLQLIRALTAEKLQGEIGGYINIQDTPENNLLSNAFTSAVSDESATKRQYREKQFSNLVNSGNIDGAKEYILQTAMETSDADTYKTVTGRVDTTLALQQIQTLLDEAEASGLSTNIVRGSMENLVRKLGTTTDPRLVDIGNRVSYALFLYRKAMTGVQFGFAESGQYEKIFPNYKNEPPVNAAAINSLIDSMKEFNDAFFERKIGTNNYRQLFGGAVVSGGTEEDPLGIK